MLEQAFSGSKKYWAWVVFLLVLIGCGVLAYLYQFNKGLGVTGMSRDVTWGFYIAQFTFLVGVAASAVMVVLPYYVHHYKNFGKITILGEFLAIGAVIMCMLFIFVDMGQPLRVVNIFLYPSPNSLMFWDSVSLGGYLVLNIIISRYTLDCEKKGIAPPKWLKPVVILSIPWAVSIHTVTAFLYQGLAARPFWLSAVMAPRFLATAFSAGPALLILLCLLLRKMTRFDVGSEPIQKLAIITTYAMLLNIFFLLMEIFTGLYSGMPDHARHFQFLYFGLDGNYRLVPWMWLSTLLAIVSLILLLIPKYRKNEKLLIIAAIAVFLSIWIDKGLGMVVTGFIPSPLGYVPDYWPTWVEATISVAIYAIGLLIVTVLYKVALSVRRMLKTT
ncbi:MAG: menaquinol oxidoreductase [Ignavibacteria bacterium GWB2_35_12]|nr:MAG: menaquinol oxidoreductase [Ignavibacteria bacterium GWB2_35_12]OGU90181.1 MAG: menaquinol oxidoreductase [Ignavibacteria bacterium RIFOXYA2_FULL_35_10]OGV21916.1 MAG: menaquinol oxidoreductase [Ignavibacteria bacterium RIFOXYC2_FULL_35_21]